MRRRGLPIAVLLGGAESVEVDLALVLAMDGSGSVDDERWRLQLRGYGDAIQRPEFVEAVKAGRLGRIAVTFVEWSDQHRHRQSIGWTLIDDTASAREFSTALAAPRHRDIPGWTSISGAIDFAVRLLRAGDFRARRQVIDVSGDGSNNDGRPAAMARDEAVAAGITINGLPILGVEPELDIYYRLNVIGGPGAFLVPVHDDESFSRAVLKKLVTEVADTRPAAGAG